MKEKVWEANLEADILHPGFLEQLAFEKFDLPAADESVYYYLDLQFTLMKRSITDRIEAFPVAPLPNLQYKIPEDKFSDILESQIADIAQRFRSTGYLVTLTCIRGEALENLDNVIITLYKNGQREYNHKGKLKSYLGHSISISGPGTRNSIMHYLASERDRIAREFAEKEEIEHIPNMVAISSIFEAAAQGVMLDKVIDDSEHQNQAMIMAAKMQRCFSVPSETPLEIKGDLGNKKWPECSIKGVDCPKWVLFVQKINKTWYIRGQRSGREAQQLAEREWANAKTLTVVVLRDLEPVSYSLLGNKGEGFVKISRAEAAGYKSIQIVWEE